MRYTDNDWMDLALELARRGEAQTSPNPMVGAVVVRNGRMLGKGFHTYAGRRHAEILALEAAGPAARGATLYTNLEPCSHTGRTGPCADALIAAGVGRVVAAIEDPNPQVSGRGLRRLRAAGIEVTSRVREPEARRLNEAFARWVRTRRPLVTLKSALTLDGQIALPSASGRAPRRGSVTWVSSEESRQQVQRMRHGADAVMTGIGTVLSDDPRLTDRTGRARRRRLLRVVLDSRLRLPLDSKLARSARGDVLVFTTQPEDSAPARALRRSGVELARVPARGGRTDLEAVIKELGRREIQSVLLEAGGELNAAALEAGIVDKVFWFYAPKISGTDLARVVRNHAGARKTMAVLRSLTLHRFGSDFAAEGYLHDVYRNH